MRRPYAAWTEGWTRRGFPLWQAYRVAGCRILLVCASLLGSATPEEQGQWNWLERELAEAQAAEERVFLFTHYPPSSAIRRRPAITTTLTQRRARGCSSSHGGTA
jgi:hypothetical protein